MATAKVGDKISFSLDGKKCEGIVSTVRDHSVIVEYGRSKKSEDPLVTVVNHKHYKIMKDA